ncbi:hypothetical protein Tco_0864086, partial [Tanacetum coccineum]
MTKARTRSGFKHRLQHSPSQCDKNIIIIVTEQFDPLVLPHVQLLLIKYVLKNLMIRKHGNGYIKNGQKMKLNWTLSTRLEERGKIEAEGIFTNGSTLRVNSPRQARPTPFRKLAWQGMTSTSIHPGDPVEFHWSNGRGKNPRARKI